MSYLVLARKWRPQVFEDVVGQRHITQTLQNAISQKRVAHAFLFAGARGVGKTSTARILAKALNCESGPGINPCNQCKTCQEISSGTAIDVIEIDGASNRGIDEIRELRENARYTPAKSRYKIFIIDEVHMLTREAFNALLKTLEEPPPHILFVFATTEPHKIPATILSRCQRYDFKRIPLNEILENLKHVVGEEEVRVSEGALLAIARESEGSMRDAQSLLDQVISFEGKEIRDEGVLEVLGLIDRKVLFDTLEAIAGQDAGRCVEIIEQVYDFGYDIQHFCRELLQYLRHLILLKVSRNPEPLMALPKEEMEVLRGLAGKFQFDQLNHLFSLLLKGEEEVAQSTFPRTMLEMTLIRMATLKSIRTIEEILGKLERLENAEGPISGVKPSPPRGEGRGSPQARGQTEGPGVDPERHSFPAPSRTRHGAAEGGKEIHKKSGQEKAAAIELSKDPVADPDLSPAPFITEAVESPEEDDAPSIETAPVPDSLEKQENVESEPAGGHEGTWKAFVDFTRARNPILGSFLGFGELVHLSEDRIEIGFEKDSFHYDRMMEKENQGLLAEICQDYLQRKAKVTVLPLEQGLKDKNGKVLEKKGTSLDPGEKASDQGEGKHPLIQEALRLFNGKIIEG